METGIHLKKNFGPVIIRKKNEFFLRAAKKILLLGTNFLRALDIYFKFHNIFFITLPKDLTNIHQFFSSVILNRSKASTYIVSVRDNLLSMDKQIPDEMLDANFELDVETDSFEMQLIPDRIVDIENSDETLKTICVSLLED